MGNVKIGTFESALSYAKEGGLIKREVVKNDTFIIIYDGELMQWCQSTGIRYPYLPTQCDLLAEDWNLFPKD